MILACQKLPGKIIKVLGLRRPLRPHVGKNSQKIPFFLSAPLIIITRSRDHLSTRFLLHGHRQDLCFLLRPHLLLVLQPVHHHDVDVDVDEHVGGDRLQS